MSPSRQRHGIGPVEGTEQQGGQRLKTSISLELTERRERGTAVLAVTVDYPARDNRTIEVPLSVTELRRFHDLSGAIAND